MKKFFTTTLALAVALVSSVFAGDFHTISFINPSVTSILITNGVGATNILTTRYITGDYAATNVAPLSYSNSTPITLTVSNVINNGGIVSTQLSASVPGYLIYVTNAATLPAAGANITNSSGQTYAAYRTNDQQNMFVDIELPYPINQPLIGAVPTNVIGNVVFTVVGNPLQTAVGASAGTNNVTAVFVGVCDGVNESSASGDAFVTTFYAASGVAAPTGATAYYLPQTFVCPLPAAKFQDCKKIRLRSLTSGTSTNSLWVSSVKFTGWYP